MALQRMYPEPTFQTLQLYSPLGVPTAQSIRIVTKIQENSRMYPVFSEAVVRKRPKDTGDAVAPNLAEAVKLAEVDLRAGQIQTRIQLQSRGAVDRGADSAG
jgi:hypothetical protein